MTQRLAILALETVLFPTMPLAVHLTDEGRRQMADDCLDGAGVFGVVPQRVPAAAEVSPVAPAPGGLRPIGTVARIISYERISETQMVLNTRGTDRFVIESIERETPYPIAAARILPPSREPSAGMIEKTRRLHALYDRVLLIARREGRMDRRTIPVPQGVERLAWFIAATAPFEPQDRQRLLRAESLKTLIDAEITLLQSLFDRHEG